MLGRGLLRSECTLPCILNCARPFCRQVENHSNLTNIYNTLHCTQKLEIWFFVEDFWIKYLQIQIGTPYQIRQRVFL